MKLLLIGNHKKASITLKSIIDKNMASIDTLSVDEEEPDSDIVNIVNKRVYDLIILDLRTMTSEAASDIMHRLTLFNPFIEAATYADIQSIEDFGDLNKYWFSKSIDIVSENPEGDLIAFLKEYMTEKGYL